MTLKQFIEQTVERYKTRPRVCESYVDTSSGTWWPSEYGELVVQMTEDEFENVLLQAIDLFEQEFKEKDNA